MTVQHVNFWWLKEPGNIDHIRELDAAACKLADIPGVLDVRVGPRSQTDWEGPEVTFDVGLIVTFESLAAVRAYQPHPHHLNAIEVSQRLCARFHAVYFDA